MTSSSRQRWDRKHNPEVEERMTRAERLEMAVRIYGTLSRSRNELRSAFRFEHLRYEDQVSDPIGFMEDVRRRSGLSSSDRWLQTIRSWSIRRDAPDRWSAEWDEAERGLLESLLAPAVNQLGCMDR